MLQYSCSVGGLCDTITSVPVARRWASAAAAAFGEAVIACAGDFIDQIAIEIDRSFTPNASARGHAGQNRSSLVPLIEIFPELGELLDKGEQPIDRLAIDPGDEPGIVRTGEAALEAVRVA